MRQNKLLKQVGNGAGEANRASPIRTSSQPRIKPRMAKEFEEATSAVDKSLVRQRLRFSNLVSNPLVCVVVYRGLPHQIAHGATGYILPPLDVRRVASGNVLLPWIALEREEVHYSVKAVVACWAICPEPWTQRFLGRSVQWNLGLTRYVVPSTPERVRMIRVNVSTLAISSSRSRLKEC